MLKTKPCIGRYGPGQELLALLLRYATARIEAWAEKPKPATGRRGRGLWGAKSRERCVSLLLLVVRPGAPSSVLCS